MMLDNAREHGVDAQEGVRVLEVLFDGDRAVGVKIRDQQNNDREVFAKVVVDASGQTAMLQNRFKLRIWDPGPEQGRDLDVLGERVPRHGRDEGATLVIQTGDKQGWFWYIPQHDNIVSVGVVAPFEHLFNKNRESHEKTYEEEVENAPGVKQRLANAKRSTGYFVTKDYSYRAREVAGNGWVLVGDAFGFLDPLYSSGVLLALKSGQLAADAIVDGLAKGDTSAAQLGAWGANFNRGVDRMRRLVCEYYAGFSFGEFVKNYPELRGTVTDLLIGDLFDDRVDKVWAPMESLYRPGSRGFRNGPRATSEEAADKANELILPEGETVDNEERKTKNEQRKRNIDMRSLAVATCVLFSGMDVHAENWPQWRGPSAERHQRRDESSRQVDARPRTSRGSCRCRRGRDRRRSSGAIAFS